MDHLTPLTVDLGQRSYPIYTGRQLGPSLCQWLGAQAEAGRPFAVVTDSHVAEAQADFMRSAFADLPVLVLDPGEPTKSVQHLETVYDFLVDSGIDRTGGLVAFGGGVIGDLAGFAAATFLRGIELVMVPTTLLSMVDSSVGGKTGINLKAGKNLAGAFYQPSAVIMDLDTLKTLPPREFSAGMAEVIKYGMLADRDLFLRLEAEPPLTVACSRLAEIVVRCCQIKADIVQADERESADKGGRALLNLGHTFGHAIENLAGYGQYLHGEAVSIGLILATRLSVSLNGMSEVWVGRVMAVLEKYDLPVRLAEPMSQEALIQVMMKDKKVKFGKLRLIGMQEIGQALTLDSVPENLIQTLWGSVMPPVPESA